MALPTGTTAPDFSLKQKTADSLVEVTLSSNFGQKNTVLLFFPFAFTGICTDEMCSVSQGLADYTDLNAIVYGISVDAPFSQEAWAKASGISIPLLSDLNKEVSAAYGVQFPELLGYTGVAKRSAFVINKDGVIIYSESSDDPKQLPDFDAIKKALQGA